VPAAAGANYDRKGANAEAKEGHRDHPEILNDKDHDDGYEYDTGFVPRCFDGEFERCIQTEFRT
jgi:hypothetical protein